MKTLKWFVAASLAFVLIPMLCAETHCPGDAVSIRPRFIDHSIIVIPVMLNGSGPYDFVLDTADQITVVDPVLAAELHLTSQGITHLIGASTYTQASYAQLESLQASAYTLNNVLALVSNLGQVQMTDPRVRGIVGQNFLEHFDLLIDNARRVVCLDETAHMRQKVKGAHIELLAPAPHPERNVPYTQQLVVPVRFSQQQEQPLHLELDSGSNAPILFNPEEHLSHARFTNASLHNRGADGGMYAFSVLLPEDIQVGRTLLHQIVFVTPVPSTNNVPNKRPDADGLLPTALFRRAFISYAEHFAVLDPW